MDLTEFWTICSSNGIVLELPQLKNIERYHNELINWNSKVNLISRKDEDNVFIRHILHSLLILKYVSFKKKAKIMDIGTGGGLPGIPLKIARPDINMVLVDSIAKKIKITGMLAAHTGLRNIEAINARAEELAAQKIHRRSYDYITARGVTKTRSILNWAKPLLKESGKVILLKGGDLKKEIREAKETVPKISTEEIKITAIGTDWFEKDNKKLLICSFK